MNRARLPFLLILCSFTLLSLAQDLPAFETITRQTADDIGLVADFYPAPENISAPPVIIALHMLNSKRAAYEPSSPTCIPPASRFSMSICAGTATQADRKFGTPPSPISAIGSVGSTRGI